MAGIYIHVPFCKQACYYCNFHFSTTLALQNDFTAALLKEIALRVGYLENETVETIYFGGGTPSLLKISEIRQMLSSIYDHFQVAPDPEITLECNPDDMQFEKLVSWKESGINRLSIGVQSFFPEDLKWMNRAHSSSQALDALEAVKKAGFENFSLDLIYGLPGLSDEKWDQNLKTAISMEPAHLSCYALTVEPKTALYSMIRQQKSADIKPDEQAVQFLRGIETLGAAGYEHYEISSFARPGKRSRHNSSYWQSKKYLGLGPSAHSFDGKTRQWNIANNALYVQSLKSGELNYESELLQPRDILNEYIMTSLRTREGLDLSQVEARFGPEKKDILQNQALEYIRLEQMIHESDRLVLTKKGLLFADGIAGSLFVD